MVEQAKRAGYFYYFNQEESRLDYIHRKAAKIMLGRPLAPGETVHHIDENKENNDIDNLLVFKTNGDHIRFHNLDPESRELLLLADGTYVCREKPTKICPCCGAAFAPSVRRGKREQKFCSHSCAAKSKSVIKIKDDEEARLNLHKQIWDKPITDVAVALGVSDTAVKKQCIKYGVPRPGRGFWNKIKAGKFEGQACPLPD
jgi:hypothetical protein